MADRILNHKPEPQLVLLLSTPLASEAGGRLGGGGFGGGGIALLPELSFTRPRPAGFICRPTVPVVDVVIVGVLRGGGGGGALGGAGFGPPSLGRI